jgi:hypothetical protein
MAVIRRSQDNAAILGTFINTLILDDISTAGHFSAASRGAA